MVSATCVLLFINVPYTHLVVPAEQVTVIPPYRPCIPAFVPRGVPLLKYALDVNEKDGTVTSDLGTVKQALINYLQNTFGGCDQNKWSFG